MTNDGTGAGLAEVVGVWGILALDAVAIYRMYAGPSMAPGLPERVAGRIGGIDQLLVFARHPALPLAVATVPIASQSLPTRDRAAVAAGAVLAGGAAGAGVRRLGRGRARAGTADAAAAAGVAGAFALTLGAAWRGGPGQIRPRGGGGGGDRARLAFGAGLVLHGLPWILADAGVYAGDVPPLGRVFLSKQTPPGGGWPAVHLGHHHGVDGTLLALGALTLARGIPEVQPAPVREALSAYLAVLLVYGTMRAAEDGWNEQVVKRGWAVRKVPLVVAAGRPVRPWLWAGMVGVAAVVHRVWGR